MKENADAAQQNRPNFAAWLDRHLEQTGVSLTAIADCAGMTPGYLSMLRRGERRNPSPEIVEKLARALGVSPEEARKGAGLPLPRVPARTSQSIGIRGARIRTRGGPRGSLPIDHLPMNWSCRMRTNQVTLHAEVQQITDDTFEVLIKLTYAGSETPNDESEAYHVRLVTDGREQAEVKASALMEGFTFTLGVGKHEFYCQRKGHDEELVLSVPLLTN